MANVPQSTPGGSYLELAGTPCGALHGVSGGDISAEVVAEPQGPGVFTKKHVGPPRYESFTFQLGFSMAPPVYDWIAASWALNYQRKSGAVVAADYKLEARSEREFTNALISETTIPALDGSAKDPAYLTVKIQPETTRTVKASGKVKNPAAKGQRQFLPENFKLEIDGLDCTRVSRIESFTVKQQPSGVEFPNLAISLAEQYAGTWTDWFDSFVVQGQNATKFEKEGRLTLLSPNRLTPLATITLHNVGIFALRHPPTVADQIARVKAELYCERMELNVPK